MQKFIARLVRKTKLTHKIYGFEFRLIKPAKISFAPGQFMMLELSNGLSRAYSIASAPKIANKIKFIVDVSPLGPASKYLLNLKVDDKVKLSGPLGEFKLRLDRQSEFVFAAAGSGIAPLSAMIDCLYESAPRAVSSIKSVRLYFGLRHCQDIFYFDKYQKLENDWPIFKFIPTLSQPEDGWNGRVGRVTKWLKEDDLPPEADYYICGNVPMAKEAEEILMARGVTKEKIHREAWGI